VSILAEDGLATNVFLGGEDINLRVKAEVKTDLHRPIIGFIVRDRLGQDLFGDNTYITYANNQVSCESNGYLVAEFHFQMPYLPTGYYSVCVAIADGTQRDHVQHHWLDEALIFQVNSSHVARGLIGIPMKEILLTAYPSLPDMR
jgi:lipopolysaccharide transport system ATP-binding protein